MSIHNGLENMTLSLGKGEVDSSILSGSTSKPPGSQVLVSRVLNRTQR